MLQDSSQNDILSPEKLEIWLSWLAQNTAHVQDPTVCPSSKKDTELEVPDSVIEMLRCVIGIPSLFGPTVSGQAKIKQCLEKLHNNRDDVTTFFKNLQAKPSTIIPLMQKLGRPLPLPVKDLIRAMEEVARDTTPASSDLRQALLVYLDLMKQQQLRLISLMEDCVEEVTSRPDNRSGYGVKGKSFFDEWVQEFEIKFVQVAKQDTYSKDLGLLINASVQVLKEQKRYRDSLGNS